MVLKNLKLLILSTLVTCGTLGTLKTCEGKPAATNQDEAIILLQTQPEPIVSSYPTIPRRLLASRTDENLWSAAARPRLPASAKSGGQEHSRTKTDMDMTIERRDDDKNQNQDSLNKQSSNNNNNNASSSMNMPRNHRRLHNKWVKSSQDGETVGDEISNAAMESVQDEGSLLYQSLKTMETHLLEADDKPEDSLENSSEKDIYLRDRPVTGTGTGVDDEQNSDEDIHISDDDDDSNGHDPSLLNDLDKNRKPTLTLIDELSGVDSNNNMPVTNNQETMLSYKSQLMKHQQNTTPKGLTTWSAVQVSPSAGFGGSIQKISSSLGFSTTSKPITTADIITKDKNRPTMFDTSMMTTTMMPPIRVETGFMSNSLSNSNTRVPNRPHNKPPIRRKPINTRKPLKYVKAPLDEVQATVIGSDETHDIYVVKTVTPDSDSDSDAELKTSSSSIIPNDEPSMTRPPWPLRTTTKKSPFSKVKTTGRPVKNSYLKRTQIPKLKRTTPTTTTTTTITTTTTTTKPHTINVHYGNPAPNLMATLPISFTNSMTFFDFIRTQIVPRIGLGIMSLMATTPLILTLWGAATFGRRKKRDLNGSSVKDDEVEYVNYADNLPKILKQLANKWEADLANNNFKSSAFGTHSSQRQSRTENETEDADDNDDESPSTAETAENYSTNSSTTQNKRYRTRRLRLKKTKKTNSLKTSVTEDDKPTEIVRTLPGLSLNYLFDRNTYELGTSPLRVYNVAYRIIQHLFSMFVWFMVTFQRH